MPCRQNLARDEINNDKDYDLFSDMDSMMFVMMSMATRHHKILLFTFSSSPLITGETCTKRPGLGFISEFFLS